jgi:hypothetical protein
VPEPSVDELYGDIVDGQGPVFVCGCGYPATTYDGRAVHVFNDDLTGTDDHEPRP